MKRSHAARLSLESLETRWCPSGSPVSAHVAEGTLHVASTAAVNLTITETSQGTFDVKNNGNPVGNSPFTGVSHSVILRLDNASDSVTINLSGHKVNGNLEVFFGKGNFTDQLAVRNGEIGQELHVAADAGTDTVTLGIASGATTLKVDHDAYVNEASSQTDSLQVNPGVTFAQALTAVSANNFDLAAGATVQGDLNLNGGSLNHTVTIEGTVGHTLYFTGSVHPDTLTVAGSADIGSLVVRLGNAPAGTSNTVSVGGTIHNLLYVLGGAGDDSITLTASADVIGQLTARLGAGNDTLTLTSGVTIANVAGDVASGGAGQDTFNGTSFAPADLKIEGFESRNP
jgi:hypothetical protein